MPTEIEILRCVAAINGECEEKDCPCFETHYEDTFVFCKEPYICEETGLTVFCKDERFSGE